MLDCSWYPLPALSEEELEMCWAAFQQFDRNGSGTIDVKELDAALQALGQHPSLDDLFVMVSQVDQDGSKEIDFAEFKRAIQINKAMSAKSASEQDTVEAFVALGGACDKTGKITVKRLLAVVEDFELLVDMEALLGEEGKEELLYDEFRQLLS